MSFLIDMRALSQLDNNLYRLSAYRFLKLEKYQNCILALVTSSDYLVSFDKLEENEEEEKGAR